MTRINANVFLMEFLFASIRVISGLKKFVSISVDWWLFPDEER
jgi:hypothetical protein